jgi:hypothetical protein
VRQELVGSALALVADVLSRHLHVAAEWQRAEPVIRITATESPDPLPEPEAEDLDANTQPFGDREVAELVEEDERSEDDRERDEHGYDTWQCVSPALADAPIGASPDSLAYPSRRRPVTIPLRRT